MSWDGAYIRKQCLILSKNNRTGIDCWLDMPADELAEWIRANNEIVAAEEAK